GDGELLPFAAGKVLPADELLAELLLVAAREFFDHLVGEALLGGTGDALEIRRLLDAADADIVARSEGIAQEILEDDADVAAKIGGGELADVDAVDGDGALFGLVEARHQLDDGGLARP